MSSLWLLTLLLTSSSGQDASQDVDRLLDLLDDSQNDTRERAHLDLVKIGEKALPRLHKALKSDRLEISTRVQKIIAEIHRKALKEGHDAFLSKLRGKAPIQVWTGVTPAT